MYYGISAIQKMLRQLRWWIITFGSSVGIFVIIGIIQNLQKLRVIWGFVEQSLIADIWSALRFSFAVSSTYTIGGFIMSLLLSLLFGINIALFVYYIRWHRGKTSHAHKTTGIAGILAGIFGVGCAACGAALIGPVFSFLGIAGILSFLPLHGQEFSLLGILLLLLSIRSLIQHFMKAPVCDIE